MRLIIDVPDALVSQAFELAMEEADDYARRYDRPGWGWTFYKCPNRYWVRGIKGGISVSLVRSQLLATADTTERNDLTREDPLIHANADTSDGKVGAGKP